MQCDIVLSSSIHIDSCNSVITGVVVFLQILHVKCALFRKIAGEGESELRMCGGPHLASCNKSHWGEMLA